MKNLAQGGEAQAMERCCDEFRTALAGSVVDRAAVGGGMGGVGGADAGVARSGSAVGAFVGVEAAIKPYTGIERNWFVYALSRRMIQQALRGEERFGLMLCGNMPDAVKSWQRQTAGGVEIHGREGKGDVIFTLK